MDLEIIEHESAQEPAIRTKAQAMLDAANRAVIDSKEAMESAVSFSVTIRNLFRKAEEERKAIVQPFNEGVSRINARFKTITHKLDQAKDVLNQKILIFQREENRKKEAEAAERRKKEEEAALEAAMAMEAVGKKAEAEARLSAAIVGPSPAVKASVVRGSGGGSFHVKKTPAFRVVDFAKLPDAYKQVNEGALASLARTGVKELAGCEWHEIQTPVLR